MSGWTIVLDVGKTLSKATLWDDEGRCVAHRARPNPRVHTGAAAALDVVGIETWLTEVLADFAGSGPVRAIVPVAHGAGAALIGHGRLLGAPVDYEWAGVAVDRAAYDRQRDRFSATGSPTLPAGLNLGIQLHWLESQSPDEFRGACLVPWAQYWAWRLSGVVATEVTSLGCHTDLWRPYTAMPSELAIRRGWADRFAPLTPAGSVLGTLLPHWVQLTGLSRLVEVHCGLHDSNAALVEARSHRALCGKDSTVLSTGTWFVAMRSPLSLDASLGAGLPETRDCLVNVDVAGLPVPSSRFMGGREIEILAGAHSIPDAGVAPGETRVAAAVRAVETDEMILPSCVPGVGPYPHAVRYTVGPTKDRTALAHLYAALLADVSLDLIGSCHTLLVEGRFAASPIFVQALASLRPTTEVLVGGDDNGVARGALRVARLPCAHGAELARAPPLPVDIAHYRRRWRAAAEHGI